MLPMLLVWLCSMDYLTPKLLSDAKLEVMYTRLPITKNWYTYHVLSVVERSEKPGKRKLDKKRRRPTKFMPKCKQTCSRKLEKKWKLIWEPKKLMQTIIIHQVVINKVDHGKEEDLILMVIEIQCNTLLWLSNKSINWPLAKPSTIFVSWIV